MCKKDNQYKFLDAAAYLLVSPQRKPIFFCNIEQKRDSPIYSTRIDLYPVRGFMQSLEGRVRNDETGTSNVHSWMTKNAILSTFRSLQLHILNLVNFNPQISYIFITISKILTFFFSTLTYWEIEIVQTCRFIEKWWEIIGTKKVFLQCAQPITSFIVNFYFFIILCHVNFDRYF